jgi:hypothetical protein
MDALGQVWGQVGGGQQGGMGNLGKILLTGLAGSGIVGNVLQSIQQSQQLNKVKSIESLTPQQLAAKVSAATQPLSAGLTQEVGNIVQANMAERGLAQAPGIFAAEEAQTLAPFYQQNQQTALELISRQLGIPVQVLQAMYSQRPNDLTNLFMKLIYGNQQPGTTNIPGLTFPTGGSSGGGGSTQGPWIYPGGTAPTFPDTSSSSIGF